MKAGDTIWRFDENRRVYSPAPAGKVYSTGGPIYREHWVATKIVGETSRSWITTHWGQKAPKRGPHPGWAFTEGEVDDRVYVHENRHLIADDVQRISDADKLRRIAAILDEK